MCSKPYKLGIIVGRFQTVHKGHEDMINRALEICEKVGVFVGSSQESGTNKNPFSFEERKEMLEIIFGEKIKVCPLPDIGVGNNSTWGDYVLENVKKEFGILPDLLVTGKEERRVSWFSSKYGKNICELHVPKRIEISSTQMREHFLKDDFEAWKEYTNPLLHDRYEKMKKTVLLSKDNLDTKSM